MGRKLGEAVLGPETCIWVLWGRKSWDLWKDLGGPVGDSRDKTGTAPEGLKATLGIHEFHQGRPSPFILTRTHRTGFSLGFQRNLRP